MTEDEARQQFADWLEKDRTVMDLVVAMLASGGLIDEINQEVDRFYEGGKFAFEHDDLDVNEPLWHVATTLKIFAETLEQENLETRLRERKIRVRASLGWSMETLTDEEIDFWAPILFGRKKEIEDSRVLPEMTITAEVEVAESQDPLGEIRSWLPQWFEDRGEVLAENGGIRMIDQGWIINELMITGGKSTSKIGMLKRMRENAGIIVERRNNHGKSSYWYAKDDLTQVLLGLDKRPNRLIDQPPQEWLASRVQNKMFRSGEGES